MVYPFLPPIHAFYGFLQMGKSITVLLVLFYSGVVNFIVSLQFRYLIHTVHGWWRKQQRY